MSDRLRSSLRIVGAVLVLLGGSIHLQQWFRNYRDQSIGVSFLVNVVLSIAVATALYARRDRWSVIAGLALAAGSLLALLASRTVGLPGFEATGYDRPEIEAIVVEALALVVLAAAVIPAGAGRRTPPSPTPARPT